MPDTINSSSALEITAHHEAGHAVVATLLGKSISSLDLLYRKREGDWIGTTPTDPTDSAAQQIIPYLNGSVLPEGAQLYPYSEDKYKNVRILCTIKCAGLIVEKRMGIDVSLKEPGGSQMDIENAIHLLENQAFSPEEQQKELCNAEICAEKLLRNPIYWDMVVNLARDLIDAVHQGRERQNSNEYINKYTFSRDKVYASFIHTLVQAIFEVRFGGICKNPQVTGNRE